MKKELRKEYGLSCYYLGNLSASMTATCRRLGSLVGNHMINLLKCLIFSQQVVLQNATAIHGIVLLQPTEALVTKMESGKSSWQT